MRMHTHAHGCQMMVEETSQTTTCFFYNTFLYLFINLFICITFVYWQVFFRRVKEAVSFKPISLILDN